MTPSKLKVISFSALMDWNYCPHYFKLTKIDKVVAFQGNVYTYWGTILHHNLQAVLKNTTTPQQASERLTRTWKKFCTLFKQKQCVGWEVSASKVLYDIHNILKQRFGNYSVINIEKRLESDVGEQWPQKFKGFIDVVLKLEDDTIVIIDIKSCSSHFAFKMFKDKFKDYQLILYKNFLMKQCPEYKNVNTFFLTVERNPRSKNPVELLEITSGKIKIKNSLAWLYKALFSINNEIFPKNKLACHKFASPEIQEGKSCIFHGTSHCPAKRINF